MTKRVAKVALNYGQRAEPRILAAGSVTRALSDTAGHLETAAVSVRLNDTDRAIRHLIELDPKRGLYNRDATLYLADKSTLDAGGTPRRLFHGKIKSVSFPGDFDVELTIEDITTFEKSTLAGDTLFPKHMIASNIVDDTSGQKADITHWPAPLAYGNLSDEHLNDPIGVVPAQYIQATSYFSDIGNVDMHFVCLGAVKQVQSVYAANFWEEGDEPTTRRRVPDDAYGDWIWVPGMPGWPGSHRYFVTDGKRYTVILAKGNNVACHLARSGRIPFTVNLCGYEDVGDGTGSMIASLPRQLAHFLINFVLNDYDGEGDWKTEVPAIAGGTYSALDMESFELTKQALDRALGKVHAGATLIGHSHRQVSFDTLMSQFLTSMGFNARLFFNKHGQIALSALDRYDSHATAFVLDQRKHLATGASFTANGEQVENVIQYAYARRYHELLAEVTEDGQVRAREPDDIEFISGIQKAESFESQEAQGRELRSEIQYMEMIRDEDVANFVVQQRLDWMQIPRVTVELPLTSFMAADLELGQVVKITHEQGIDHLGWTERRCMIERIVIDLDNESSNITVRDLYDLLPNESVVKGSASSRLNIGVLGIMRLNVP